MDISKTITSIFMVPTLGIKLSKLKENGYINGFSIDGMTADNYEDAIYLLFKPLNIHKFRNFVEKQYEMCDFIIDDYDYPEGYVVLVYSLDPGFKKDFDLIREGKYSDTSFEFQNRFPKDVLVNTGHNTTKERSLQFKIFKKSKSLSNYWEELIGKPLTECQEVWAGYDEQKETLKILKL